MILESTGSHCVGVDLMQPVMIRITLLSSVLILFVCELFSHTGEQYSAGAKTSARAAVLSVVAVAPHLVADRLLTKLTLVLNLAESFSM